MLSWLLLIPMMKCLVVAGLRRAWRVKVIRLHDDPRGGNYRTVRTTGVCGSGLAGENALLHPARRRPAAGEGTLTA